MNDKKAVVLVVEDYSVEQRLLQILIEEIGLEAKVVENGKAALAALDANPDQYSLILMDVAMAGMNGLECTRTIREREREREREQEQTENITRHIPIIGVTACVLEGDQQACLDAGMDDYLSKPFKLEQFSAIINKWMLTHQ
ncbi:response regulator [bacterium]|nr:response regulator [bacterium]QQR59990.1 MAG: response regulator [Candidatus Melainabacteria bacterium]